jgi:hypothetical protein
LECAVGEVRGSGGVAGAAAHDEAAVWWSAFGDFANVVGGEVGGWVGGAALPSWAPVADDGAVVGDQALSTSAFLGVVVEVGAAYCLGPVLFALAVEAAGFASDGAAAADAVAE